MSASAASGPRAGISAATLVSVGLISAALLAYEIVLMRRLLLEHWHHFGYLVISVALLGFGASGTWLALVERRVRARPDVALLWLSLLLGTLLLVMPRVAARLPVTARFIPEDLWRQVGWWSLYWLTGLVPFFVGAAFLGAALLTAGRHVGRVYGANLIGSAVGAAGAALVVARFPIECGHWPSFVLTLGAAVILWLDGGRVWRDSGRWLGPAGVALLGVAALAADAHWPLTPAYDEYKYAATLQQLVAQGSARRVAAAADPHGYVELYESPLFHDLPFLALSEPPPPMYSVVINGDAAGSILRIADASQAKVMDRTLMAFPYRLIRPSPRVLLIGEIGGANVWLGRRQAASQITVVQPNAALVALWRHYAAPLLDCASLSLRVTDPRAFLVSRREERPYDLIQIASLEGLGVGSTGMRGLAEDHLATVEGFAACLRELGPDGVLAISRGIQQPERENIRLFATLVEALETLGVADPSRHMVQVRDYLGACTIALRSPLTDERRVALRAAIREFNLTPVWYDGLATEEVNQPDTLDGPPGTSVDWLHHAAREILSPRRAQLYDAWLLNVRPPHDDNPFFWDFYKPLGVAALKQAYGDLWLTRAELGRLFLYTSLLIAGAAGVVLILVPLTFAELLHRPGAVCNSGVSRDEVPPRTCGRHGGRPLHSARDPSDGECAGVARQRSGPGRRRSASDPLAPGRTTLAMLVYFGGIGLGFMGIEMALISRAIHWLGDPVMASALVIGGVLVISGVGSLTGRYLVRDRIWVAPAIVAIAATVVRLVGWGPAGAGGVGPWLLLVGTLPATYFMGMPMPAGLAVLHDHAPRLAPWAWGVNGVASVLATSAALVVAMTTGYRTVVLLAAGAYALAALAAPALSSRPRNS